MTTLAERLVQARTSSGISQGELAKRIGIKQPSVAALEAGRAQSTSKIVEIARALSVSPLWLATGEGERDLRHYVGSTP